MKQKTTVLQPLLMCVLCVFLLCFVVVNVAADDVFITNVANEMKEEGERALKANEKFFVNVDKAIKALNDSVEAIATAEDDVQKITSEAEKLKKILMS